MRGCGNYSKQWAVYIENCALPRGQREVDVCKLIGSSKLTGFVARHVIASRRSTVATSELFRFRTSSSMSARPRDEDVSGLALNGLAGGRGQCSGDITTLGGRHGLTSGSTKRDLRCERQPTQTFNRYGQHRELTAHHAAHSNSVAQQITAASKMSLRFENWFRTGCDQRKIWRHFCANLCYDISRTVWPRWSRPTRLTYAEPG